MQDEQPQIILQKIVTYSDGQQVLIQEMPGVSVSVDVDNEHVVNEQRLNGLDQQQFTDLAEKAMTHDIQADTIGENISVIPKDQAIADMQTLTTETQSQEGVNLA